jgi:hypothetical protein
MSIRHDRNMSSRGDRCGLTPSSSHLAVIPIAPRPLGSAAPSRPSSQSQFLIHHQHPAIRQIGPVRSNPTNGQHFSSQSRLPPPITRSIPPPAPQTAPVQKSFLGVNIPSQPAVHDTYNVSPNVSPNIVPTKSEDVPTSVVSTSRQAATSRSSLPTSTLSAALPLSTSTVLKTFSHNGNIHNSDMTDNNANHDNARNGVARNGVARNDVARNGTDVAPVKARGSSITQNTHDMDGQWSHELTRLQNHDLFPKAQLIASVIVGWTNNTEDIQKIGVFKEAILKHNPQASPFFQCILNGSGNVDTSNRTDALILLVFLSFMYASEETTINKSDLISLVAEQLADMKTGACAEGRTTRLMQIIESLCL